MQIIHHTRSEKESLLQKRRAWTASPGGTGSAEQKVDTLTSQERAKLDKEAENIIKRAKTERGGKVRYIVDELKVMSDKVKVLGTGVGEKFKKYVKKKAQVDIDLTNEGLSQQNYITGLEELAQQKEGTILRELDECLDVVILRVEMRKEMTRALGEEGVTDQSEKEEIGGILERNLSALEKGEYKIPDTESFNQQYEVMHEAVKYARMVKRLEDEKITSVDKCIPMCDIGIAYPLQTPYNEKDLVIFNYWTENNIVYAIDNVVGRIQKYDIHGKGYGQSKGEGAWVFLDELKVPDGASAVVRTFIESEIQKEKNIEGNRKDHIDTVEKSLETLALKLGNKAKESLTGANESALAIKLAKENHVNETIAAIAIQWAKKSDPARKTELVKEMVHEMKEQMIRNMEHERTFIKADDRRYHDYKKESGDLYSTLQKKHRALETEQKTRYENPVEYGAGGSTQSVWPKLFGYIQSADSKSEINAMSPRWRNRPEREATADSAPRIDTLEEEGTPLAIQAGMPQDVYKKLPLIAKGRVNTLLKGELTVAERKIHIMELWKASVTAANENKTEMSQAIAKAIRFVEEQLIEADGSPAIQEGLGADIYLQLSNDEREAVDNIVGNAVEWNKSYIEGRSYDQSDWEIVRGIVDPKLLEDTVQFLYEYNRGSKVVKRVTEEYLPHSNEKTSAEDSIAVAEVFTRDEYNRISIQAQNVLNALVTYVITRDFVNAKKMYKLLIRQLDEEVKRLWNNEEERRPLETIFEKASSFIEQRKAMSEETSKEERADSEAAASHPGEGAEWTEERIQKRIKEIERTDVPGGEIKLSSDPQSVKDKVSEIKGRLVDYSDEVHYPNLLKAGGIDARMANTFYAPMLKEVRGHLILDRAQNISAKSLKKIEGDLHAEKAESFDSQELTHVTGNVTLPGAGDLSGGYLNHYMQLRRSPMNHEDATVEIEIETMPSVGIYKFDRNQYENLPAGGKHALDDLMREGYDEEKYDANMETLEDLLDETDESTWKEARALRHAMAFAKEAWKKENDDEGKSDNSEDLISGADEMTDEDWENALQEDGKLEEKEAEEPNSTKKWQEMLEKDASGEINTIDLTEAPPEIKNGITQINGNLIDNSGGVVSYQKLVRVGTLEAKYATKFNAPELKGVSVMLDVRSATALEITKLETVDSLNAWSAEVFNAPELKTADGVMTIGATTINTPKLEYAFCIAAGGKVVSLNIDKLTRVGDRLFIPQIKEFNAPELISVKSYLDVRDAEKFSAPKLQNVGDVLWASNVENFSAPELITIGGNLYLNKAKSFSAPKLKSAGSLRIEKVTEFNAPFIVHLKEERQDLPDIEFNNEYVEMRREGKSHDDATAEIESARTGGEKERSELPEEWRKKLQADAAGETINVTDAPPEVKRAITTIKGNIIDNSKGWVSYTNLESVGGNIYVTDAITFRANKLQTVGGSLALADALRVHIDKLETVEGDLTIGNKTAFNVPELNRVGGYLNGRNISECTAPKLKTVVKWVRLPDITIENKYLKLRAEGKSHDQANEEIESMPPRQPRKIG